MLNADYYRSLSLELRALKDRVRAFIDDAHWLTDGAWKESVLRSLLRRHLPRTIEVGYGFVVSEAGCSTQIDVMLFDASKPVLFRDGDLALVTPDAVEGVIEVKTSVSRGELASAVTKLADISELIEERAPSHRRFYGLFAYNDRSGDIDNALQALRANAQGRGSRVIKCICLGENRFIRYWEVDPLHGNRPYYKWRAYDVDQEAQGYFIHNVIGCVSPESVTANSAIWFPAIGKEARVIGEIALSDDQASVKQRTAEGPKRPRSQSRRRS
jgi:hypothetical protein